MVTQAIVKKSWFALSLSRTLLDVYQNWACIKFRQEPVSRGIQLPHQPYTTTILQTDLLLVHIFFHEVKAVLVQWREWPQHSHGSLIPGKFDQRYIGIWKRRDRNIVTFK